MSKVKIQGNASGTGVLTITAPNTSTDRTITLPDTTGTLLDENSSVPAANLTGTVADARISTLTASKLTGALPAISGANLTGISAGKVLQAVTDTDSSLQTFSSTSYGWVSNLTASITPSSTSSKILVIASIPYTVHRVSGSRTDIFSNLKLMRSIGAADTALQTTTPGISGNGDTVQVLQGLATFVLLDSPSTTSSTIYRVMARSRPDAAEINMKINYDYGGYTKGEPASITAIEIGA